MYSQMSVLSSFGMQPTGFVKPLLADIRSAMNAQYQAIYGNPNIQDGSRIGTRIGIVSKLLADSWEGAEAAYNAPFPTKGDDTSFADVMDLVGLAMLPATATQVICTITVAGTHVGMISLPVGFPITDPSGNIFQMIAPSFQVLGTGGGPYSQDCTFQAVNTGPTTATASTTWNYMAPSDFPNDMTISSIVNTQDGTIGSNAETPAEARLRRSNSLQVIGAANIGAIVSRVRNNVPGIGTCRGFENDDDVADAVGRPPHSIEIMVTNGTDADIAAMLWKCKAGGISFYGSSSAIVQDSQGNNQTVRFTRASSIAMAVEVTITRYSEELLPSNYEALIMAAVQGYAASFAIGQDMLIDRWLGPVYAACSGLDKITIRQAINGGGWQTDDIAVPYNQYPGVVTVTIVGP